MMRSIRKIIEGYFLNHLEWVIRGDFMKKYDIQLLINSHSNYLYWRGLESDKSPKMINEGVIKIGEVYFNAINIEEVIIVENQ